MIRPYKRRGRCFLLGCPNDGLPYKRLRICQQHLEQMRLIAAKQAAEDLRRPA